MSNLSILADIILTKLSIIPKRTDMSKHYGILNCRDDGSTENGKLHSTGYIHRVPKKHVTTFSTITLTISVRLK